MIGIKAYGGYVPRRRLPRQVIVEANSWFNAGLKAYAKGERSMCNWDEDTLTMAVEASRDCVGKERPEGIKAIYLASTTLPFADRQNAGVLGTALNLGQNLMTMDISSSLRAGTSGLINALHSAQGLGGDVLYTAAEHRKSRTANQNELMYGDGAAALLLGDGEVAAELLAAHQVAVDFVDHYRFQTEEFDYNWEERWIRDEGYAKIVPPAIEAALEKALEDKTAAEQALRSERRGDDDATLARLASAETELEKTKRELAAMRTSAASESSTATTEYANKIASLLVQATEAERARDEMKAAADAERRRFEEGRKKAREMLEEKDRAIDA